jgi:hypothetical protein
LQVSSSSYKTGITGIYNPHSDPILPNDIRIHNLYSGRYHPYVENLDIFIQADMAAGTGSRLFRGHLFTHHINTKKYERRSDVLQHG